MRLHALVPQCARDTAYMDVCLCVCAWRRSGSVFVSAVVLCPCLCMDPSLHVCNFPRVCACQHAYIHITYLVFISHIQVKDSDVDDFLEELAAAPPASAVTTTALAAAGGVSAVTSGESLGRGSTLEAAGGDEEEESCDERGRGGQGAGGNGELGGSGEGGSGQGEGEGGTDVSPSPAAMEAEQNATGGGANQVDTEVMGRVCFAVLTLKREGDAIIESLKDAIAEEPVGGEGGAGARREVLLTLLGGMLSWSGLVSDLGILVSDQMTNAFARSVEIMLPKLRLRLEKCASALAAQVCLHGGGRMYLLRERERDALTVGCCRMYLLRERERHALTVGCCRTLNGKRRCKRYSLRDGAVLLSRMV